MIAYPKKYCSHCGEMAFCHHASNPGCGGMAKYGVASFDNKAGERKEDMRMPQTRLLQHSFFLFCFKNIH